MLNQENAMLTELNTRLREETRILTREVEALLYELKQARLELSSSVLVKQYARSLDEYLKEGRILNRLLLQSLTDEPSWIKALMQKMEYLVVNYPDDKINMEAYEYLKSVKILFHGDGDGSE